LWAIWGKILDFILKPAYHPVKELGFMMEKTYKIDVIPEPAGRVLRR
jgi:hypothetical protein